MLPQDMRRRYLYLQSANCKEEIVSLLRQFVQRTDIDDMDRCWAYWNISDNLAMLRRPEEEVENHRRFAALLDTMEPVYLPWMVSDATQRLTLAAGGQESFWNGLYAHVCADTPRVPQNARIRFEAHRAAATMAAGLRTDEALGLAALTNLGESAMELENEGGFYRLIYLTLALAADNRMGRNIAANLEEARQCFLRMVNTAASAAVMPQESREEWLLGSWEQLNARRGLYEQAAVSTGNFIIQLVRLQEYRLAADCHEKTAAFVFRRNRTYQEMIRTAYENLR